MSQSERPAAGSSRRKVARALLATSVLASFVLPANGQFTAEYIPYSVPELDPGLLGRALAILFGGLLVLTSRLRAKDK